MRKKKRRRLGDGGDVTCATPYVTTGRMGCSCSLAGAGLQEHMKLNHRSASTNLNMASRSERTHQSGAARGEVGDDIGMALNRMGSGGCCNDLGKGQRMKMGIEV